jgi:hypothetical protein
MSRGYPCPCCEYLTLSEQSLGSYEICPVCGWEDDIVQFENPDMKGGANLVSLNQAKSNFKKIGAIDDNIKKNVRPPKPDEIPIKLL